MALGSIAVRHDQASSAGWKWRADGDACVVSTTSSKGPATALRLGDQIVSVNGRRITWGDPSIPLGMVYAGQLYTIAAKRGAEILSLPLHMANHPGIDGDVAATLATALMLFLAGIWILISGPGSLTARLALATFLLSSLAMTGLVLILYPGWGSVTTTLALILAKLSGPLYMAVGWDFISAFPPGSRRTADPLLSADLLRAGADLMGRRELAVFVRNRPSAVLTGVSNPGVTRPKQFVWNRVRNNHLPSSLFGTVSKLSAAG